MCDLSKRKGSNKWYFRKRWPTDVAGILGEEFVKSTREEDKRAAEARLPVLTAEYHSRIDAARTIDKYEADKGAGWSVATKRACEPVARLLRDVFGDRDVRGISRDDAKELRKLLERLPVNLGRQKALEDLTIPQAVAKAQKLGLPTIQPKTVNSKYIVTIAAVFNWARQEQWIASTPFGGLMVHDPVAPEDKRDRFEVDQLTTIFSSGPWQSPWADDGRKAGAFATVSHHGTFASAVNAAFAPMYRNTTVPSV